MPLHPSPTVGVAWGRGLLQRPPSDLVLLLSTDTLPTDPGCPADTAQRPLCRGPHSCWAEEHLGGVGAGRRGRTERKGDLVGGRWGGCAQKEGFEFRVSSRASVLPPCRWCRPFSKPLLCHSLPIPRVPVLAAPITLPSLLSSLSLFLL